MIETPDAETEQPLFMVLPCCVVRGILNTQRTRDVTGWSGLTQAKQSTKKATNSLQIHEQNTQVVPLLGVIKPAMHNNFQTLMLNKKFQAYKCLNSHNKSPEKYDSSRIAKYQSKTDTLMGSDFQYAHRIICGPRLACPFWIRPWPNLSLLVCIRLDSPAIPSCCIIMPSCCNAAQNK